MPLPSLEQVYYGSRCMGDTREGVLMQVTCSTHSPRPKYWVTSSFRYVMTMLTLFHLLGGEFQTSNTEDPRVIVFEEGSVHPEWGHPESDFRYIHTAFSFLLCFNSTTKRLAWWENQIGRLNMQDIEWAPGPELRLGFHHYNLSPWLEHVTMVIGWVDLTVDLSTAPTTTPLHRLVVDL